MKKILFSILGLIVVGGYCTSLAGVTKDELHDAAYSGDNDFLQEKYGEFKTKKIPGPVSPADLVGEALAGHQYQTIKWCVAEDPDPNKLSGWFDSKQMDVKAAKIIFDQVPTLKTNYGNKSLDCAILADNLQIVKFLLDSGVRPTNERRPPPSLLVAAQLRRFDAISLLLKHRADPYEKGPTGFSPVELAIMLKSSSLLEALDRDKKYRTELDDIRKEINLQNGASFAGTWADLHEGFGSASITIYSDGTGVFGSDIGGIPCILIQTNQGTKLVLLEGNPNSLSGLKPDEAHATDIKVDGDDFVLGMNGSERRMKKFNPEESNEQFLARRPYFVRIEKICISPSDDLYVQINGRFIKIPIAQLVSGAQETSYGLEVVEKNMIRWADFQKGQIPQNILTNSTEVPFVDKHADPRYSIGWQKVGFDHEHLASTEEGHDFTLFPSSTTEYYHGPNTGRYGEHVDCFVLLSKKPFSQGKDWLMFFFLKSKSNDSPQQSPW
jgi:hypothetical protein